MTIEQIQSIQKHLNSLRELATSLLNTNQIELATYIHNSCHSIEMEVYSMEPAQSKPKCACTNS